MCVERVYFQLMHTDMTICVCICPDIAYCLWLAYRKIKTATFMPISTLSVAKFLHSWPSSMQRSCIIGNGQ